MTTARARDSSLIELKEPPAYLVTLHGYLSAALPGQVHGVAKHTMAQPHIQTYVFLSDIFPKLRLLLQIFLRTGADQHN